MQREEGFIPTSDGLHLYYQIPGRGSDTIIIPAASWPEPFSSHSTFFPGQVT